MPPGRRKSNNPTTHSTRSSASQQSTISFNNQSRVTKPSIADPHTKKPHSKLLEPAEHEAVEITTASTPEPETTEIAIRESPRKTPSKPKTKSRTKQKTPLSAQDSAEAIASKISDAQLKRYWQAEEDTRLAPRVHQDALATNEKILRHFDLSSQFGPCIGIPRLRRWQRANTLGLEPPIEVLAVLLKEEKKGPRSSCGKLAYIDELAGGKAVLVE